MKRTSKLLVPLVAIVGALSLATAGWAYWTTTGTGSGSAAVGTLTVPGTPAGTVDSGTVSLSWSASTVSGGSTVEYHIERRPDPGSTWTDVCGSSALAPITGTSCSNAPGAGTYIFRVTAVYLSWTQVGSESDPISVVLDTTPPSVTVNQKVGQPDPTNTLPILYTVTFSEPVTGFVAADLTRTGSSTGGTVTLTGSGADYEIAVTGTPTNGTLTFTVAAAKAIDAAGNNNTASTSTDNTVTFDTVAPSGGSVSAAVSSGPAPFKAVVSFTNGTDSGSGLNTASGQILRATASQNGKSGNCTEFSTFSVVASNQSSPYTDTSSTETGTCYQYKYSISDNAGNVSTYGPTVRVIPNSN
jgi:hypothetical protein